MSQTLNELFLMCEQLISSCDIDYSNTRIVNSFLFNSYEYPFETEERVENIGLVLESYGVLKDIYTKVKDASKRV